jgi:hypothetical protein
MNTLNWVSLWLVLFAAPMSAEAFENGPIDARVTDAVTHAPVIGAIVVARWERGHSSIAAGWESCEHVQVVVTDAQGRYHIDRWSHFDNPIEWLFAGSFHLEVHGYRAGMIYPLPPVSSFDERNGDLQLVPYEGSQPAHMDYLWHEAIVSCGYDGTDAKILRPLREAVYVEARTIATDGAHDQGMLSAIRGQIQQGEGSIVTAPSVPAASAPALLPAPAAPSQSAPQMDEAPPK